MLIRSQQPAVAQEFHRYFNLRSANDKGIAWGSFFGRGMGNRDAMSEIIAGRLYLSNMPKYYPPLELSSLVKADGDHAGLIVSCVDIYELAQSQLLLEPGGKRIKFHVLAMEDGSAGVGSYYQIYEALALMSQFADSGKPIQIHCREGVGRSAMMTALHLAHRYLLNDPVVKSCLDSVLEKSNKKLDPAGHDFLSQLYDAACRYVLGKRSCCQFEDGQRHRLAVFVLKEVTYLIKHGRALVENRDENYNFLAELVQLSEFKKLQHYSCRMAGSKIQCINDFLNALFYNKDGWYQKLVDATHAELSDTANPLYYFCHTDSTVEGKTQVSFVPAQHEILVDLLGAINRLAERYPNVLYSQQVAKHKPESGIAFNCGK